MSYFQVVTTGTNDLTFSLSPSASDGDNVLVISTGDYNLEIGQF